MTEPGIFSNIVGDAPKPIGLFDNLFEKKKKVAQQPEPNPPPVISEPQDDTPDLVSLSPKPTEEEASNNFVADTVEGAKNFFLDIPLIAIGGARDFAQDMVGATFDISKMWQETARENPAFLTLIPGGLNVIPFKDLDIGDKPSELPQVKQPRTSLGKISRDITRMSLAFVPIFRAMKGFGSMKAAVAASAFSMGLMEPAEENLANLVQKYPGVRNPITTFLDADPDDSRMERRFKEALIGAGLGATFEKLLPMLKLLRMGRKAGVSEAVADDAARGLPSERAAANPATNPATKITMEDLLERRGPIPVNPGNRLTPQQLLSRSGPAPAKTVGASNIKEILKIREELLVQRAKGTAASTKKIAGLGARLDELLNPPGQKFAGNINLSRQGISQQAKRSEMAVAETLHANRVVSNRETQALAEMANTTSDVIERRGYDAAGMLQLRQKLADSADKIPALAKAANGGSEESLVAFNNHLDLHVALQRDVSGATAEVGRTLQQQKIIAQTEKVRQRFIKEIIESKGGRDTIEAKAAALADIDDPAILARMIPKLQKATTKEKITEIWINGLLSGIPTHVVNFGSNLLVAAYSVPERLVTAGFSTAEAGLRRITGAAPAAERVFFREVNAKMSGVIRGSKEALMAAWRQLAFEESPLMFTRVSKVEGRFQSISGLKGKLIRIPTRFLESSDVFFKMINYSGELEALSVRDAIKRGFKGSALRDHVAVLLSDPPEKMAAKAWGVAQKNTFTNPLAEQEGIVAGLGRLTQQAAQNFALVKAIAPFIRTPVNIFKFSGERTPLGFISKDMRTALKTPATRAEALAKVSLGSASSAVAVNYVLDGDVTGGGPINPTERRALRQTGWQPYSIKVEGKYYSYARFEPLGSLLGITADAVNIYKAGAATDKEWKDIAAMITMAFSRNATNKTFMRGMTEAISAIDPKNPLGSPAKFLEQLGGSLVPTFVSQMAKADDPVVRDIRGIIDRWKSRIPGLSQDLQPLQNLWGQNISRDGGFGNSLLSPVYISKDKNDKVSNELVRLKLSPTMPPRKIGGVELTPDQYTRFVKMSGQPAHQVLNGIMKGKGWSDVPAFEQGEIIKRVIRLHRDAAVSILRGENNGRLAIEIEQLALNNRGIDVDLSKQQVPVSRLAPQQAPQDAPGGSF